MKILVIEPHGDDAFISCSSILMSNHEIHLLTCSDRESSGLEQYYPSIKSSRYLDIPDVHYDYRLKYKTHEIHRKFLAGEPLYDQYINDMEFMIEFDKEFEIVYRKFEESYISKIDIDNDFKEYDLFIIPVGLFHPNHYATRSQMDVSLPPETPRIYYVDKPYIEKRYIQEILKSAPYFKYITAPVQDKETRAKIFKDVYPTEQGLLRFSSKSILEWKDIYAIPDEFRSNECILNFISTISDMKEGDKYENLICNAYQD